MTDLSILCVTKLERHAVEFLRRLIVVAQLVPDTELVVAADGDEAWDAIQDWPKLGCENELSTNIRVLKVRSLGYIESVLQHCVEACRGEYVLRIDDDEACSPLMVHWLRDGRYKTADHWKFSRAHLWPDLHHYITDLPLWPDQQTRLSLKHLAGGRHYIHGGSPYGGGFHAPVVLEHHKFLVRTEAERREIGQRYDRVAPGAGISGGMRAFQLPDLGAVRVTAHNGGVDVPVAVDEAYRVGVFQHRQELEPFASWLAERRPRNVLELGTLHGGTTALWYQLVTGRVVTVDLPDGRFGSRDHGYDQVHSEERSERLKQLYPRVVPILGDSHAPATFQAVTEALRGEQVDLLFIDGDHTYEGVKADYENFKVLVRPGGVIAFHDVLTTPMHRAHGCEVDKFWREVPGHKAVFSVNGPWGGIGVTFA